MSRDGSGNYTLPAGNPPTTLTTITVTWASNTMSDIATELTDSLNRSGKGAMLAALKLYAGAVGAPGLTFSDETTTGWYRAGANDIRFSLAGADVFSIDASRISSFKSFRLTGTAPELYFYETDAGVDEKLWRFNVNGDVLALVTRTDADAAGVACVTVTRSGTAVTEIDLTASTIKLIGTTIIETTQPDLYFNDTNAAAGNQRWRISGSAEQFFMQTRSDDNTTGTTWLTVDRTGNTVDSIALAATALTFNSADVATDEAGSYAASYMGFASPPAGTIYWRRVGNLVSLRFTSATATSNATNFSESSGSMPASIRPGVQRIVAVPYLQDNGSNLAAYVTIATNGNMTFSTLAGGATGWTASGSKGMPAVMLVYSL